jgi:hypothetical protein
MMSAPDVPATRLQFYERLADTELFMLLGAEPAGDQVEPAIFEVEGQKIVPVFDREERLASFTGRPAPYAGLPGRALVGMLSGQGIGLGLNLDVAPSQMLIPAEAVDWLTATLQNAPKQTEARLSQLLPPKQLPEAMITGLDRKLAIAAGLAQRAYLAAAVYEDGGQGHVLVFIDAVEGAETALANAAAEVLTFSGLDAGVMDVLFARSADSLVGHLERVGVRFDLPQPPAAVTPAAPGTDPNKPPRLR